MVLSQKKDWFVKYGDGNFWSMHWRDALMVLDQCSGFI
jgi:hypothetical protein